LVLGVSNSNVRVVEGHNSSGGKLPLSHVLQGNFPTKDAADASIRVLVSMTRVLVAFLFGLVLLIGPLVIPMVIFVTVLITARIV
jgi:thiol:disulfide interchange protein